MMECNIVLHRGHHVQHGGSDGDSCVLGDHDESGREMKSYDGKIHCENTANSHFSGDNWQKKTSIPLH